MMKIWGIYHFLTLISIDNQYLKGLIQETLKMKIENL